MTTRVVCLDGSKSRSSSSRNTAKVLWSMERVEGGGDEGGIALIMQIYVM